MAPKRLMVVYGTRPEAIKVAPIIRALSNDEELSAVAVSTGQHREMLDQVNKVFGITPDYDLDCFEKGQDLNKLAGKVFTRLGALFDECTPDAVLVQGDTTTVSVAAQAAFYRQIPVIHLEAGLRSGDISTPFPEEANRRLTTQVASLHLAPTKTSEQNLLNEGVNPDNIAVTGNTVIDALLYATDQKVTFSDSKLNSIAKSDKPVVLVTCHRRENWKKLESVGLALRDIATNFPEYQLVFPVHGNPLLREALVPHIEGLENVYVCEPLAYLEFAAMLKRAHIILSDSGGVQEEAPSVGTPVLCMRESTERPEAVEAGGVKLVGTDRELILSSFKQLATDPNTYSAMTNVSNPFGNGDAAEKSIKAIKKLLGI
ncbi:UDP-N-acetylglucosamine 2-epimerase [Boudabousia tangfeifanii]|uniref:UDP-N-acetylglucosamine 2-epimerase (non-hydrolyzing) n=1 Tax=Boudabousia tangfeifanii TaxID=1912795 RepID=A0A1D9MIC6_9ACTO|nr:UDP-N-acetylglucosamine 2-epimerase (non-hydrolyzing) [Boudabousia tangfeifanii]AOZ71958.1 UDP-N-acetylglucosamine 2-epimerase [Boudabousia tangfeifanii]